MSISKIEWTDTTWNPLTGCTKISDGCKYCYAERMSYRLQAMGNKNYKDGFKLTLHPHTLTIPYRWKKGRLIFVNSMSDLFHEDVPLEYIEKVFRTINDCKQHIFQVLTKRSSRLAQLAHKLQWPTNLWMGVSVESERYIYRIDNLRKTGAHIKFLSLEPLISGMPELQLHEIDWVIVGGESGPSARPMLKEWVLDLKEQCLKAKVPFFFKQWGGKNKKKAGRLLDGVIWDEYPEEIQRLAQDRRKPLL